MVKAGLPIPAGGPATSLAEAEAVAQEAGYPLLVRASFALGGSGASWVYRPEELAEAVRKAIAESPIGQAWIEQSIMGWKEYELEVMRDRADNFVVVCSIENLDPMGVHTGDSITVAPAQTLTDPEYQVLRDLARKVMTAVGVETGGSNVQFAVDPAHRTHGHHRNEPARLALVGPGLEGHRLSHRQDRRPGGGRLHPRRDRQRHHRCDAAPPSSRHWITSLSRSRAGPSRSSPASSSRSARR